VDAVVAGQGEVEQPLALVLAEPAPQPPELGEHPSVRGRGGPREVLAGRPGEDPFGQGVQQDRGARAVHAVVGADDARRERLKALARRARHVVVDQHGEGLDQRRRAPRRIRVRLAGQEGHERHEAHPALARIADAAADEFHPIEGPVQSHIEVHCGAPSAVPPARAHAVPPAALWTV
jgi:hypothetical protein